MRVLLISANTEQISILPLPLGLNCVAVAARNAGHEVEMLDLMTRGDIRASVEDAVRALHPEAIGISVRNIDDQSMHAPRFLLGRVRELVSLCRELSGAPIILGGAGFSIFPESTLAYLDADMGIQGEGEAVFPMILDLLQKGLPLSGVPGLFLKGSGLQGQRVYEKALDALPLPDPALSKHSLAGDAEIWLPVQTRRGCPMDCSYCSTGAIEGRRIRKRSPKLVVDNMALHVEAGFRNFYFVDNTFNLPVSYAAGLCEEIRRRGLGISWRSIIYPGRIDEKLVDLMARAGCVEVSLGFESGCDRILEAMNKKYRALDIRRASEMLRRSGIRSMGFLLLGGPGETRESVLESLSFADSLGLDAMKISRGIRIYPHTGLAETARVEGLVTPGDDLLSPKFYCAPGLGAWLEETVESWMESRPHWMG